MKENLKALGGLVAFCAVLFLCDHPAPATSFPPANASDTINQTLVAPTLLQTNLAGSSFFVESVRYHTVQINNTGTNTSYVGIDRSLDGSHWVVVATNTVAAASSGETTMEGRWSYVRARCYSTNSPMTVLYLGGN